MKITIISDVLGVENNGTTITTMRLIENLKARGHEVCVVSPLKKDSEKEFISLKVRRFPFLNRYVEKNGVQLAKPDRQILTSAVKDSDIVHIILPFKTGRCALKIARNFNIPVTAGYHCQAENVTSHMLLKNSKLANGYLYRRFYRKFYKFVDFIHCPSPFIAREIRKHGYKTDIRVISNGVHPVYRKMTVVKPQELQDKYCILFIGRFSHEKRHDILIKAAYASKYSDRLQLIFAGDGPTKEFMAKLGSKLKNPPNINFFTKEKLAETINYCDLYVHPSDIEIEAIACLEAITCGLVPIISDSIKSATNAFALSDINLFKRGDHISLAQKIDYMIENPEIVNLIKAQYLDYAAQFRIEQCIDKMEEMFRDAIKKHEKTQI